MTRPDLRFAPGMLTAIALAWMAGGGLADAAGPPDASAHVLVGDLHLSHPTDVTILGRRIARAAETLCGRQDQLDFVETGACYRRLADEVLDGLPPPQRQQLLAACRKRPAGWLACS